MLVTLLITFNTTSDMEKTYTSVDAGKSCLSGRIGWIKRTGTTISAEIDAFKDRNTDGGACRLEDLVDKLNKSFDKLQVCADWLTSQAGTDEASISTKVDNASALCKTLREEIATCLKDYAVTPTQAQPEKSNHD